MVHGVCIQNYSVYETRCTSIGIYVILVAVQEAEYHIWKNDDDDDDDDQAMYKVRARDAWQ